MGWDQKDAVGELLEGGDHVKIFRFSQRLGSTIVGEHVGEVVKVVSVEHGKYEGNFQICLDFGDGEGGWVHQSSVMKV